MEKARQEVAEQVAERKADYERRLALQRAALEEESQTIQKALEPKIGLLSAVFANRLQSWQTRPEKPGDTDPTAIPYAADKTQKDWDQ